MVALNIIRESNSRLAELGPGLVALFVGGTGGIGEFTAKAFVQNTISPRVYLVGRSAPAAERIIEECKALNKDGKVEFIKADVSELREVDRACKEIMGREKGINLIVQTQGNLNLRGLDESPEGLDRKFTLNYYSRMRFISNLLPLLRNASTTTPNFSRSLSVLAPGTEERVNVNNLGLKNTFSTRRCAAHSVVMNDFMTEEFATRAPETSFLHLYPSFVNTDIARELPLWARFPVKVISSILSSFSVSLEETGQRQLFHATSGIYRPAKLTGGSISAAGVPLSKELTVAEGADGKSGSGAYLVNWNGDIIPQKAFLKDYRQQGLGTTTWEHTMGVFARVEKLNSEV